MNSTCIDSNYTKLAHNFDILYARRAFVHWFVGEGISNGEFGEAREGLASLQKDIEELDYHLSGRVYNDEEEEEF